MCVHLSICLSVCLCPGLCSNLFSYVLQRVQWILYALSRRRRRCSLLHHSFMFLFEYNTSVCTA